MTDDDTFYGDMQELAKQHRETLRRRQPQSPPLKQSWPHDQDDWTFLGRAIQEMGHSLFKSDWTGREGNNIRKKILAQKHESLHDSIAEMERRRYVLDELRTALGERKLQAGYRSLLDESVKLLPPEIWQKAVFDDACKDFQVDLTVLAGSGTDRSPQWVFVSRGDLQAICGRGNAPTASRAPAKHSPKQAIKSMMSAYPETPCPKDRVFERLSAAHELSEREFLSLWSQVAAEIAPAWSKSGRRPKQSAAEIEEILRALNRRT